MLKHCSRHQNEKMMQDLFLTLILWVHPPRLDNLWSKFKHTMTERTIYRLKKTYSTFTDEQCNQK